MSLSLLNTATFIGEHLVYGVIGHIALIGAFVCAIFCCISLWVHHQYEQKQGYDGFYKKIGVAFFIIKALLLILSFILLIVIIQNHYFEYKYVWQHSSTTLNFKYLLSSIWEGQEGSFLLWALWHGLLGLVLIFRKQIYYPQLLFFIALCQAIISSMLLGIYVGDAKIGSDPFILMRDFFTDAPIFTQENYLNFITDGNGLNELLQNYWMVIHPPVLFLGYALTIVPFSYACVSLWKNEQLIALRFAQQWALLAAGVLGLGIMMGGAWAYESLSFGGYWAWDPVENASLVPWLILIAAIHSCIISVKKQKAYRTTYIFIGLSFGFVLYSSYLTRSGILGDTSVHAFTDLEMGVQLILLMLLSMLPFIILLVAKWNSIYKSPKPKNEDHISSREFWVSIGTLLLFFSSLYIILATSIPVINKLFGTQWAIGEDVAFSYNKVMIWSAIFILLLSSISFYLKFKKTTSQFIRKKIVFPLFIYTALSIFLSLLFGFEYNNNGLGFKIFIYITFVCTLISISLHLHFFVLVSKKSIGTIISHTGFAILIAGILLSSSNKEILSHNYSGFFQDFGKNSTEDPRENITLIKNIPTSMPPYKVTYIGDSTAPDDSKTYFIVDFVDSLNNDAFRLYPNAFVNTKGKQGLLSNPDKRHYMLSDIFVYITSIPDASKKNETTEITTYVKSGDTTFLSLGFFITRFTENKISITGMDRYFNSFDTSIYVQKASALSFLKLPQLASELTISRLPLFANTSEANVEIKIKEQGFLSYVTLKVYRFPYINLVWLGIIMLFVGFIIAWLKKRNENRSQK